MLVSWYNVNEIVFGMKEKPTKLQIIYLRWFSHTAYVKINSKKCFCCVADDNQASSFKFTN